MTRPNICKEQSCNEEIREDHDLCSKHCTRKRKGAINECPQCGVYKDANYLYCIKCHKSQRKQKTRKYDPVRADTFDERAALLEDDPKAKDKRQLFHDQDRKCVYCGNVYPYDELQIEHMIPKILGGPDDIRNCQLTCRRCNQAKGTMTDIEFRKKYASYLPQEERTPAQPPVNPKKFQISTSPPKGSAEHRDEPERASRRHSGALRGPADGHGDSDSYGQLEEERQRRKWHIVGVGLLVLILVGSSVTWYALQPGQPSDQIIALEELEKYERARDAGLQALEDYVIQNPNSPYLDQAKDLIRAYKDEK